MKKYILAFVLLNGIFSCKKEPITPEDLTPPEEVATTLTPDSPVWKRLSSPSIYRYNDGGISANITTMFTGTMYRADTLNDGLFIDNSSSIITNGNVDYRTLATGYYSPSGDRWFLSLKLGLPRYSSMVLGIFAITGRYEQVNFFSLLGSGYTINENYPDGKSYINDIWMRANEETGEKIKEGVLLTGFMANNNGYFFENDAEKQMWHINNSQIYKKITTFYEPFLGNIACASTKIKGKEYGFVLSESTSPKAKTKSFYQFDTSTETWAKRADFPGEDRMEGVLFGIHGKIYYGLGQSKTEAKGFRDIWEYDPTTNAWTKFATYPGGGNIKLMTTTVSGKAYIGMGYQIAKTAIGTEKYVGALDFWEFVPSKKQ
jgi:hypothetical protein